MSFANNQEKQFEKLSKKFAVSNVNYDEIKQSLKPVWAMQSRMYVRCKVHKNFVDNCSSFQPMCDALCDLCHLYNLKKTIKKPMEVLLLVKLQASTRNFTKSNTPPWVFFTFSKLYKWYQIAQNVILFNLLSSWHQEIEHYYFHIWCFVAIVPCFSSL